METYRQILDRAQSAIERRDEAHEELEDVLDGEQQEPLQPSTPMHLSSGAPGEAPRRVAGRRARR